MEDQVVAEMGHKSDDDEEEELKVWQSQKYLENSEQEKLNSLILYVLQHNYQQTKATVEGRLSSLIQKILYYISRPDRLRNIADRFNLDQNAVLDNVLYARAYTSEHQYELLDFVAAKFYEEPGVFKLLIIDSVFSGRGELADRQQKLAQLLSRLQKISEEYNVACFVTNQMTADPGAAMSPDLPENEATFAISGGGIVDAKD